MIKKYVFILNINKYITSNKNKNTFNYLHILR
jgi:hypothetical protein